MERALITSLSLKDGNYVIGRTNVLNELFEFNKLNLHLKRLYISSEQWTPKLNNEFVRNVIQDLDQGKPVYACIDTSIAPDRASVMAHFHCNFVSNPPPGQYFAVFAIEMSQILSQPVTITEESISLPPNLKLFKIQKCDTCKTDIKCDISNDLKQLLDILLKFEMDKNISVLRIRGGSNKILVGGRWRNQHYIKVGKQKKVAVVKYNGLYVPVSFVEKMSK
jgi:hypothetical protein